MDFIPLKRDKSPVRQIKKRYFDRFDKLPKTYDEVVKVWTIQKINKILEDLFSKITFEELLNSDDDVRDPFLRALALIIVKHNLIDKITEMSISLTFFDYLSLKKEISKIKNCDSIQVTMSKILVETKNNETLLTYLAKRKNYTLNCYCNILKTKLNNKSATLFDIKKELNSTNIHQVLFVIVLIIKYEQKKSKPLITILSDIKILLNPLYIETILYQI